MGGGDSSKKNSATLALQKLDQQSLGDSAIAQSFSRHRFVHPNNNKPTADSVFGFKFLKGRRRRDGESLSIESSIYLEGDSVSTDTHFYLANGSLNVQKPHVFNDSLYVEQ